MIQCSQDPKNEQRERNHNLTSEDFDSVFEFEVCKEDPVTMFEMCIKEVRETCIGFVQRQAKIYVNDIVQKHYLDQGVSPQCVPQCLKSIKSAESQRQVCDRGNGKCDCLHNNFAGHHCNICADGYHGDKCQFQGKPGI